MKKYLILLILFLFISVPTQAVTWIKIADNEYIDKDNIKTYIDDNNKKHKEQKVFWTKTINKNDNLFPNVQKTLDKRIGYVMAQQIIDFQRESITLKSVIVYDDDEKVIETYTNNDCALNWNSIAPNTNSAFLYNIVQNKRFLKLFEKFN